MRDKRVDALIDTIEDNFNLVCSKHQNSITTGPVCRLKDGKNKYCACMGRLSFCELEPPNGKA